jgi:hypothetical protein
VAVDPSVLFVVRGDETVPSCRFRAYQFREPLARLGVRADFLRIERSRDLRAQLAFYTELTRRARGYGAVVYQKLPEPARIALLRAVNANVFYDFDDAMYAERGAGAFAAWRARQRFALSVRAAPRVIAGNDVLARHARAHNTQVDIVPTTVIVPPAAPSPPGTGPLRLSWIGTSDNLPYLEPVLAALAALRAGGLAIELHLLTERPERAPAPPGVHVERWSPAAESAALARAEIGLMPLSDDEWSRGKCACKALQYLSFGRPVITSPVGVNRALFADKAYGVLVSEPHEWTEAIRILAQRRGELQVIGADGRRMVERDYDVEVWAPRLRALLLGPTS